MKKEEAKLRIEELIAKFSRYEKEGRLARISENDTKAIFIEPLFEALGWKMHEVEEVSRESALSKGRVDYSFKTSGVVHFFIEAKAAGVVLGEKETKQAIDYSYYQSVPWVLLTNFRQLIIYNSDWREGEQRFLKFEFNEYASRMDELWHLSKESILKGKLDAYAQRVGKGKPREPVTKTLYADLREWRGALTRNIAKHSRMNKLSKEQIDEGVQRLLNRLVFIRTCEDRGIENQRLMEAVRSFRLENKRKLSRYLGDITDEFNEIYDSDLFSPHLAGELYLDAEVLQEVVVGLYTYDFSAINADVLGNVYEQYLATVMREGGGMLKKNGKRKEMGIYYTPTYIVDYIVKNTLGELVAKAKTAEDLKKIKILDPACGSGSFLIRAFEVLREAYSKKNSGDHQMLGENVSKNAHDILTKNIHGVDLDIKAIEIVYLNLLLRAATRRGLLPPLSDNIKRGNSLISGTEEEMEKLFGPHWKEKKHPLNWEDEFKEVMDAGGFDVVIGNPPYIRSRNLESDDREYFSKIYQTAYRTFDIYILFIERALSLLKAGGFFAFIVPYSLLNQPYATKLRKIILDECTILEIVDLSEFKVFQDAQVKNCIVICRKGKSKQESFKSTIVDGAIKKTEKIAPDDFYNNSDYMFKLEITSESKPLIQKIQQESLQLKEIAYISKGVEVYERDSGRTKQEFIHHTKKAGYKKYLEAKETDRYAISWNGNYLDYQPEKHCSSKFPELFENQKILMKRIMGRGRISTTFDDENYYVENTLICCLMKISLAKKLQFEESELNIASKYDLKFLLGLLNSKLISYYFKIKLGDKLQIYNRAIEELPVPKKIEHEQQPIIKLVDKMLEMNKKLIEMGDVKTTERQRLEEEIKRTDAQIDEHVYKLYGITEKEKKIIEESFKK